MKRRTEAGGKLRRTIKRNNGNSSALFFYMKIVLIWSSVIFCDYMSELRFEYLWPFWLLCRSVFDSYKYKGLAFSFLFICIAITSDLICLFLIPLQWIFFVASTVVWIQFIWIHNLPDKGICLPTILIWLLFVWMEAKIRWKDNQKMPHLDLCRPFAAHCIGYPVVSLGFGFKSYLGYKIRQRKQKEIAKENEFYMQLLQQALPQEEVDKSQEPVDTSPTSNENIQNCKNDQNQQKNQANGSIDNINGTANGTSNHHKHHNFKKNAEKENEYLHSVENNHQDLPNNTVLTKPGTKANNLNFNNLQSVKNTNTTSYQQIQNGIKELNLSPNNKCSPYKNNTYVSSNACKKEYEKEKIIKDTSYEDTILVEPSSQKKKDKQKDSQQYHQQHQILATNNPQNEKAKVCEQCQKLEQEAKRLKSEVQAMKSLDQELKQKFDAIKGNLNSKQKENEEAQRQINDLQTQERRNRQFFESQIKELKEKKLRKHADEKINLTRCPESCKIKKMQLEGENNKLRREIMLMEETKQNLEKLLYEQSLELRKYDRNRDQSQNADMAMRTALALMQEKNLTLEKNLSAETRVKLDLFSALGEARRQLEIKENFLRSKDKQLEDLKSKTAQILAVMPNSISSVESQLNSIHLMNESRGVDSQLG